MRLRDPLLRTVARTVVARPWSLIGISGLLALLAVLTAGRALVIDTDYNSLLPSDNPSVVGMRRVLEEHGAVSHIMILVEGGNAASRAAFADTLAARLEARPDVIRSAMSRVPVEWFRRRGLLYLEPDQIRAFEKELAAQPEPYRRLLHAGDAATLLEAASDLIETRYIEGEGELTSEEDDRATALLRDLVDLAVLAADAGDAVRDPADFAARLDPALDRLMLAGRAETGRGSWTEERVVSKDREALLVIARAARSTLAEEGREFIRDTMDGVNEAIEATSRIVPGVTAVVTGPIPQQAVEEEVIRSDFRRTGRLAGFLITLALVVGLRLWIAPLLALIPLAMAVAWELGLVSVTIGRLNVFSVMFVAIVLGLGIDFGIHLIVRYREERRKGGDETGAERGIARAILGTGSAVTTGALTTVFAFGALVWSHYPAFRELGLVASTGIGLSFVAFVTVMPALLLLKDRLLDRTPTARRYLLQETVSLSVLSRIGRSIERHPGRWAAGLVAWTTAAIALALGAPDGLPGPVGEWWGRGVRFRGDLLMAQPDTPAHRLQVEIVDRFDMGGECYYLSARDMAAAREATRVLENLDLGPDLPPLGRIVSPARLVPPDQPERIQAATGLRDRLRDIATHPPANRESTHSSTTDPLESALLRLQNNVVEMGDLAYLSGLTHLPAAADSLARRLAAAIPLTRTTTTTARAAADREIRLAIAERRDALLDPAQAIPFTVADLPPALREEFIGRNGRLLISVYGTHQTYDDRLNQAVTRALRDRFPDVTGVPVLYADLLGLSRLEGVRSARLACLLVFLAVLADLRRLGLSLLTMIPITVGLAWTVGLMRVLGWDFDFANVVAAPLLLGIGIDDGVHLVHRYREEGAGSISWVLGITGRAIFLTTLTTAIGFGVFEIAHHRGLESLGRLVVLGVVSCFVASVTALPAALALTERWRSRGRPEPAGTAGRSGKAG